MQTDVIIQTERLTLREMTHDDYDILYAVLSDSDIMRHYPYTFDEKRVRGWIDRNRQRYSDFGFELWAVCLADCGGRTRKRYDPDRRIYRRQGRTVACISYNPHGMVEK